MTFAGEPEPPEPPARDEWLDMLVRLRTYGSVVVADAYEEFADAVRNFYFQVPNVRLVKEKGAAEEAVPVLEEFESARKNVREKLTALERLVSQELESL